MNHLVDNAYRIFCRIALTSFFALSMGVGTGDAATEINDVSQLNPIRVERVATPTTTEEVQILVREWKGPISMGGARHSMGGQIATDGCLFLDMRRLDKIVSFSTEQRTITVEAGITWRKIQEAIDPFDLSIKIMQSYAGFTVGGSLSVNAHGRYVGQGPLVSSVRSIAIVLANGDLVEADRQNNSELFYAAIGGYGSIGVIVRATLDLVGNDRLERHVRRLDVAQYKDFFFREIRDSTTAVMHNADLYPPNYDLVSAITFQRTDRPVTIPERLHPFAKFNWDTRAVQFAIAKVPLSKQAREYLLDPWRLRGTPVVWRNYEASYDASEIEPRSRRRSTYILQEYFIPEQRIDEFIPAMAGIFKRSKANILNVSIRHARRDSESTMSWAREDVFAFVIYYEQKSTPAARLAVGKWTRELIDEALKLGGTYYLPYQLHATNEQFKRAYPRAEELFTLKAKVDPENRFRNKLWDRYYSPPAVK